MDDSVTIHLLSFEGPDPYARAGGIATRVVDLADALAARGLETHLWFVGDPAAPGHADRGAVRLHRWCQWISAHHPAGVYDGEDGKRYDYAESLPQWLVREHIGPGAVRGRRSIVLAEEWHTADCVVRLDALLRACGLRDRVTILWNANNTFGFDRIDWVALRSAAVITTVSRYMKQVMRGHGVEARVVPNGLGCDAFEAPDRCAVAAIRAKTRGRVLLAKVARWDPDKAWLETVDAVADLRAHGHRPLLVARGGVEAHGTDVLARAAASGLRVSSRNAGSGAAGIADALGEADHADMLCLTTPLDGPAKRALFRAAAAVLANSAHEPFGLVGLEAMAAGGVACTGCTGEDYASDGLDAIVLQTQEPREVVRAVERVAGREGSGAALRRAAVRAARRWSWGEVLERSLLPCIATGDPS